MNRLFLTNRVFHIVLGVTFCAGWLCLNNHFEYDKAAMVTSFIFFCVLYLALSKSLLLHFLSKKYKSQSSLLSEIFQKYGNIIDASELSSLKQKDVKFNDLKNSASSVSYKISRRDENGNVCLYNAYFPQADDYAENATILGYVQNTTEVDMLKEKILLQNAQLSSIMNNLPFAIYLKDTDGRFIAGNYKFYELFNVKSEDISGKYFTDVCLKEHAQQIKNDDALVLQSKKTRLTEIKSALVSDEDEWFRVSKSPIIGPNKKVLGLIVIIYDITKEKELELQRDTFVATLTHDLKTPTRAQLTVMDLLLSGSLGDLNEEQRDMISQVKNSNIYMSNMISTILATYKSDASDIKLEIEDFDFFEVVNETCKELAGLADGREQKIVLKSDLKNPTISGDKLQLKRAVTNLVSNAIIHGFEKSEVVVQISEKRNNIIFDVKNQSRYIDDEKLAEIFEKYKTIKHAKSYKASTGLGLYLSRKIIQMHQGKIYAKSWKDQTCVFGFSIPKNLSKKLQQAK